ncbi:MAG TPA: alkaline phosphatase family protein, partial [Thermoplasmata archaeon]|nr:alkaline phosphatase family protein [Thermoplasmata archaeon]
PPRATGPVALVVLDGLGDRPHPATENRSPVDAASTPNLDRLASAGAMGSVVVVGPGVAPESDAGVFALLGYDPEKDSPGRGVLEALGVDLPLAPEDVALRLNFATSDGAGLILDSRVGRSLSTHESEELARALTDADLVADEGVRAEVRATVGHRGVLWLRATSDGALSPNITNADPFYEKKGGMGQARQPETPRILVVQPTDGSTAAGRTAHVLNQFLSRVGPVLAGHRVNARRALAGRRIANCLLVRNAGQLPPTPPVAFEAKWGLHGAALTEMPVEKGIAKVLFLEDRYVGPMGPDREAGYRERARIARELLTRFPFIYVHLKGPDEPGHDGEAVRKKEVVEAIDRSFFGPFLEGLDLGQVRIAITADHATPAIIKAHTDDPVPLLLVGEGFGPGRPRTHFGAPDFASGPLGEHLGSDVVKLLLGHGPVPPV